MSPEIRDALDAARTSALDTPVALHEVKPQRRHAFERVRMIVLSVLRELPDDMTLKELREDLEDCFHD